jgi:hypothetical protein
MRYCLELASASGAFGYEREQDEPLPTLSELGGIMRSRQRVYVPAA